MFVASHSIIQGSDMTRIIVAILFLTAFVVQAKASTYTDTEGTRYSYSVNLDGIVLTPTDGGTPLYLGRSCDTYSPRYGTGTWSWANGGFTLNFPERRFGFLRQELPANRGTDCRL